jgi:hypothetical protein
MDTMSTRQKLRTAYGAGKRSGGMFLRHAGNGLREISHSTLALVGLALVVATVVVAGRPDLREQTEARALDWLQDRAVARTSADDDITAATAEAAAVSRATAVHPSELTKQQAAVAKWISRRYNVALEPVGRLVQEAWSIGQRVGLDPTLILAIAAIESRFNPFAQSAVGAQGLMQVMTRVHTDKFEPFGGAHAAFDPISNLKVGVQILRECIARAGGLEAGLRWYVGAANTLDDGGYIGKVLTEQGHMKRVASGGTVSTRVPIGLPKPVVREAALVPLEAPEKPASAADERVALLER